MSVNATAGTTGSAAAQPTQADYNMQNAADAWNGALKAHPGATLEVRYRDGSHAQFSDPRSLTPEAFSQAVSFRVVGQAASDRHGGVTPSVFTDTTRFEPMPMSFRPNVAPKSWPKAPEGGGVATARSARAAAPAPNDFRGQAKVLFPGARTPTEQSDATKGLQTALAKLHFLPTGSRVDGLPGTDTQRALRDFTAFYGLPPTTSPSEAARLAQVVGHADPIKPNPANDPLNMPAFYAVSQYGSARMQILKSISAEAQKTSPDHAQLSVLLHQLDALDTRARLLNDGVVSNAQIDEFNAWRANPASIPTT